MALPFDKLLSGVTPGGYVTGAMRDYNALRQSDLENQIKRVQAQYAPYSAYADAASKLAYSQFVGPQSISSILNNPATRGMFTPDQYNQLAKAFTNQVGAPTSVFANLPIPGQQQQSSPFQQLVNLFRGGQSSSLPKMPQAQQANGQMFQQMPQQISQQSDLPQQSTTPLSGTSPSYDRLSANLSPGTYGAASPSAITSAGEAGLKAQSEAEAKAITDQWRERQDDIRTQSAGAIEMENQLSRLESLRPELGTLEKGFPFGYLPGVSSAAQESGLVENNLIAARLKAWQSNRITNMDIGFGKGMKPGRWMNDESFTNEINYERGLSKRLQEYSPFSNAAQSMGLSPSKADAAWIRYVNEKPFFDPKYKKPINENLDTWEEYLTPESLKQTFSPTYRKKMNQYKNNMAGSNPEKDNEIQKKYSVNSGQSRGAEILSNKIQFPTFNNKEQFLNWYNKQDSFVQHAVRMKLGEK